MSERSVLLRVVSGPLTAAIAIGSIWILLRGHQEPGGGFIGGLVAVSGTILRAVSRPRTEAAARRRADRLLALAAVGCTAAAAAGAVGWLLGRGFLCHLHLDLALGPLTLPLSTVLLFDAGVYLCVWGALGGYGLGLIGGERTGDRDAEGEGRA